MWAPHVSDCRTRTCVRLKSPDPLVRDSICPGGVPVGLTATPIRSLHARIPQQLQLQKTQALTLPEPSAGAVPPPTPGLRTAPRYRALPVPAGCPRPPRAGTALALVSSSALGQARPGTQYCAHPVADQTPTFESVTADGASTVPSSSTVRVRRPELSPECLSVVR